MGCRAWAWFLPRFPVIFFPYGIFSAGFFWPIFRRITFFVGLNVYRWIVELYFTYCSIVWDSMGQTLESNFQNLQNRAARVTMGASYSKHSADIRHDLGWLSLTELRQLHMALMIFKVNHCLCLSYLSGMFDVNTSWLSYNLCSQLIVPQARTNYF